MAWWRPDAVIQAARQHELRLMPPTAVCLAQVGAYAQLEEALQARPDLRPVRPAVADTGDALWLTAPLDLEFPL